MTEPKPANGVRQIVPNPDPSTLTTDALHREVSSLTTLFNAHIEAQERAIDENKAHGTEVAQLRADIALAKEETGRERFKSIETQFALRDTAADKLDIAGKTAIAAALQAQKE